MSGSSWWPRMKKVAVFVLLAGLCILAAAAQTKNYYFPEVRTEIAVEKDGGFLVEEFRTYEFQGSFSWTDLRIPLAVTRSGRSVRATLTDFAVSDESGRPLATETGLVDGAFQAKWFYSARNERRTFRIRYRIRGGIRTYPDVTELYWQVIGDGWDRPTKKVTIDVRLPEPLGSRAALKVWGHGPLTGRAEIVDERTARFTAVDVRSRQYVEIRVLWPSGIVSGVPSTGESLASIERD